MGWELMSSGSTEAEPTLQSWAVDQGICSFGSILGSWCVASLLGLQLPCLRSFHADIGSAKGFLGC